MAKKAYRDTSTGLTGRLLEETYFGKAPLTIDFGTVPIPADIKNPEFQLFMRLGGKLTGRLEFPEAITFAKKFQPQIMPRVARDLVASIQRRLGPSAKLNFFTAVGTPLDRFHDIDCFIEVEQPGRKKFPRIKIDITKNPSKTRADSTGDYFIMEELPDYGDIDELQGYKEKIESYADDYATELKLQIEHPEMEREQWNPISASSSEVFRRTNETRPINPPSEGTVPRPKRQVFIIPPPRKHENRFKRR